MAHGLQISIGRGAIAGSMSGMGQIRPNNRNQIGSCSELLPDRALPPDEIRTWTMVAAECPVLSQHGMAKSLIQKVVGNGGPTRVKLGTGF
jgi:hypothetical protein